MMPFVHDIWIFRANVAILKIVVKHSMKHLELAQWFINVLVKILQIIHIAAHV